MNRITFPLRFRMKGPQVANLREGLEALGFHVAGAERENQFYGGGTVKVVRDFQKSVSLPESGAVDKKTAAALN